jgi:hypothetical protein
MSFDELWPGKVTASFDRSDAERDVQQYDDDCDADWMLSRRPVTQLPRYR